MSLEYYPKNLPIHLFLWLFFMLIGILYINEWVRTTDKYKSIKSVVIINLIWNSLNFLIKLIRPFFFFIHIHFLVLMYFLALPLSYFILARLIRCYYKVKFSEVSTMLSMAFIGFEFIINFLFSVFFPIIAIELDI